MAKVDHFYPCCSLPEGIAKEPLLVAVCFDRLLCHKNSNSFLFCSDQLPAVASSSSHYLLGVYNGRPCYVAELDSADDHYPENLEWRALRSLLGAVDDLHFDLAGRAVQILKWELGHRFCGGCGKPTVTVDADCSRLCTHCDQAFYPRISPCIIVVITKGDHCLLASNAKWEGRYYSALAGFIEPGETVESALHREVMEEVGLEVENLTYFGSQPWPFPGQLMLGFHAEYKAGEIAVDNHEIVAADWWHYENLPPCPEPSTLSGRLIESFVDHCRASDNT